MGIIGAMEYVQDNKKLLEERAVAYINMDMLVHGNDSLKAIGNPMTRELVYAQSKKVSDPHGPDETIYSVWKRARPDLTKKDLPQYCTAGFGSDYIPFYEIAGTICHHVWLHRWMDYYTNPLMFLYCRSSKH